MNFILKLGFGQDQKHFDTKKIIKFETNKVENANHFLLECPTYKDIKSNFQKTCNKEKFHNLLPIITKRYLEISFPSYLLIAPRDTLYNTCEGLCHIYYTDVEHVGSKKLY
jgi:hypothetical protein